MQTVLDAIDVIRRGGDERELSRALRRLAVELDRRFGTRPDHIDVRQVVLLKVARHAATCRAAAPGAAFRWLERVYEHSTIDYARTQRRAPRLLRDGVVPELEAPPAPVPDGLAEEVVEALFERLEVYLEESLPRASERVSASLRAELAWARHVEGKTPAELAEALASRMAEPPKTDTLYKWIERGRERVWLPFLERWAGSDEPVDVVAAQARWVFLDARRKDAGRPREVARGRVAGGGVSSRGDRASVQYDGVEPEEGHDA